MKTHFAFLFIIFCSFCKFSFSQNLVPNWSFEDTVACPTNLDQVNRAVGWSSYRESPDYFNSCASYGGFAGVPLNQFDYQFPKTGEAYCGFFTKTTATNYREVIGIQLTQPLTIGNYYFVSFFVNRVGTINGQNKNIGTNKIGVRFSSFSYSFINPIPIDNFAHIYTDSIVSDTAGWTEIKGFLLADSSYQYLSIGNFFHDTLTSFILYDPTATSAYYFVDDITVLDSIPLNVNEYHSNIVNIFPNPARDWIEIRGGGIKEIVIYDVLGNLCYKAADNFTSPQRISISNLSNGVYLLQFLSAKRIITKKFIKL